MATIAQLGSGNSGKTSGTSHSASITIPSGTDLLVIIAWRARTVAGTTVAPTSVTVAAVAATDTGITPSGTQDISWIKMYYYLSPPSGAQTVAASGGGIASDETGYIWSAYSGAAQSGQPDSAVDAGSSTTTAFGMTTTVVAANSWVICGFTNQGIAPSSYTNGTSRQFVTPNVGEGIVDSNGALSAGAYTITVNQTSQLISGIAASFKPAVDATTSPDLRTYHYA